MAPFINNKTMREGSVKRYWSNVEFIFASIRTALEADLQSRLALKDVHATSVACSRKIDGRWIRSEEKSQYTNPQRNSSMQCPTWRKSIDGHKRRKSVCRRCNARRRRCHRYGESSPSKKHPGGAFRTDTYTVVPCGKPFHFGTKLQKRTIVRLGVPHNGGEV